MTGSSPIILFCDPLFPPMSRVLECLRKILVSRGLSKSLADIFDDYPWPPNFPLEKNYTHGLLEPILNRLQDSLLPAQKCERLEKYSYEMRKAITDYSEKIKDLLLFINWIEATRDAGSWTVYGVPKILDNIYFLSHGKNAPQSCRSTIKACRTINFIGLLLLLSAGFIWLFFRIRLFPPKPKKYRLIADRVGHADAEFYKSIVDDPSELLILDRNPQLARALRHTNGPFLSCLLGDCKIGITKFMLLLLATVTNLLWIWRVVGHHDPQLFWRFAASAIKRQRFAAFFCNFTTKFFFGRDDYSIDHIIRNQELRAIGGKSLGINHGLPLNTYASQWREVDFDIYYAYGRHLYEHFYKLTWASNVHVKPVGTFRMTHKHRSRLEVNRPRDIGFFPIVIKTFDQTMEEAFKVANHFSDRKFYIKMKSGRNRQDIERFREKMSDAPLNVIAYTHPDPYELLLNISYGICFTTLVAEALQFKVKTFNLDMDPTLEHQYYRNFYNLTVPDGETIIRRIEAIELGEEAYDFELYKDLISIDGPDILNVVRSDIGLGPQ